MEIDAPAAAAEPRTSIHRLQPTDVNRICSGQVVTTLSTAVKELVENALDAHATSVEVRLLEYGAEMIEVSDNGTGIRADDYRSVTAKSWTSKITEFEDIYATRTFGFRGEALAALCELSESVVITTRTATDEVGMQLTYDRTGALVAQEPVPRAQGTTVRVSKVFSPLPVRHREFLKSLKKQYARLLWTLQAYGMIARGVKLNVLNQLTGSSASMAAAYSILSVADADDVEQTPSRQGGARKGVISTSGSARLSDCIVEVMGYKFYGSLVPVRVDLATLTVDTAAAVTFEDADTQLPVPALPPLPSISLPGSSEQYIEGFVSKMGEGVGRSNNERQFVFLNGRPVDAPKVRVTAAWCAGANQRGATREFVQILKTVNDVWRTFEVNSKPACVLNLILRPGMYDINVTPDKREVLLVNEAALLERIRGGLAALWEPSRGTFKVSPMLTQPLPFQPTQRGTTARDDPPAAPEPAAAAASSPHIGNTTVSDDAATSVSPAVPEARERLLEADPTQASVTDSALMVAATSTLPRVDERVPQSSLQSGDGCVSEDAVSSTVHEHRRTSDVAATPSPVAPSRGKRRSIEDAVRSRRSQRVEAESQPASTPPRSEIIRTFANASSIGNSLGESGNTEVGAAARDTAADTGAAMEEVEAASPRHRSGRKRRAEDAPAVEQPSPSRIIDVEAEPSKSPAVRKRARTRVWAVHEHDILTALQHRLGSQRAAVSSGVLLDSYPFQVSRPASAGGASQPLTAASQPAVTTEEDGLIALSASPDQALQPAAVQLRTRAEDDDERRAAEAALSRVLRKADFEVMCRKIIGQFNLGFIVAGVEQDLYILDQHACDEKHQFEYLRENTIIHEQRLIVPRAIELTAGEELVVMDNLEVFRRNGFHFQVDTSQPAGQRLMLTAVPFSQKTQFGDEDVRELASILQDTGYHSAPGPAVATSACAHRSGMPRIPKALAMFASRACRSAVMIGDTLHRDKMRRIVEALAELEQPWNCPHGRPTMRHLVDLSHVRHDQEPAGPVIAMLVPTDEPEL